jgi:hypothetical protein
MFALDELTASEMAAVVRAGRRTCEAITRARLERMAARNAQVLGKRNRDHDRFACANCIHRKRV